MSRYTPYQPNERIVDRAVALWMTMLERPKYDNLGDDSPESAESIRANRAASMLTTMIPKNNTKPILDKFGVELRKILIGPFEYESEYGCKTSKQTMLVGYGYGSPHVYPLSAQGGPMACDDALWRRHCEVNRAR